ncbi:hypothetical protein CAter10_3489 [Collimonas arenae]|nr:hypothetical protein CAter10_3489 [Collimonas arenae]
MRNYNNEYFSCTEEFLMAMDRLFRLMREKEASDMFLAPGSPFI